MGTKEDKKTFLVICYAVLVQYLHQLLPHKGSWAQCGRRRFRHFERVKVNRRMSLEPPDVRPRGVHKRFIDEPGNVIVLR